METYHGFSLNFGSEDQAFSDGPVEETLSLLREIARKIESGRREGVCLDSNGNRIGQWSFNR